MVSAQNFTIGASLWFLHTPQKETKSKTRLNRTSCWCGKWLFTIKKVVKKGNESSYRTIYKIRNCTLLKNEVKNARSEQVEDQSNVKSLLFPVYFSLHMEMFCPLSIIFIGCFRRAVLFKKRDLFVCFMWQSVTFFLCCRRQLPMISSTEKHAD